MLHFGCRALGIGLCLGLFAAPGLRAAGESITVEPPFATIDDVVVAVVHQTDSCRVWFDPAPPDGGPLTVMGREGLSPCPASAAAELTTQRVVLGRLTAGAYAVRALLQSTQMVLATASFTVGPASPLGAWSLAVEPRLPTSSDEVSLRVSGRATCLVGFAGATVEGPVVRLQPIHLPIDPCPPFTLDQTLALGALAAGEYRVVIDASPIGGFHVDPPAAYLAFSFGGVNEISRWFRATLDRAEPTAHEPQLAPAIALGNQAGYFWFFDPGNVEVSIKLLDGRPVNGHFWLFASSLTDRPFTLTVEDQGHCDIVFDSPVCPTRTYAGRAGETRNVVDLNAFAD